MEKKISHYYGDIVRALFLSAAIIMLFGLPAVRNYISVPTIISVLGILVLVLAAGLTNPKLIVYAIINTIVASLGFVVFEIYAVVSFRHYGELDRFFLSNLVLGLIFLVSVYFSVKTVRGLYLNKESNLIN